MRKSLTDRLVEDRARAGVASHARKEATGLIKPSPRKRGQSIGTFGGKTAVGRAKEVKMITYHFLVDLTPIELNYLRSSPVSVRIGRGYGAPRYESNVQSGSQHKGSDNKGFFQR